MFSKYIVIASSVFAALISAESKVDLDSLLLLPGVKSHDGNNTVFSTSDFYKESFVDSIAPAIVNSSVIFHDVSRGVVIGNVRSRTIYSETYFDWEQYQVVNSGDWETDWAPISDCIWIDEKDESDDVPDVFTISVPYSWTFEYSIVDYDKDANEDGLDFKLIKSLIDEKHPLKKITDTASESGSRTVPMLHDVVQLWYSKLMIWADVQRQHCSGIRAPHTICSAWSRYYRVDAPTYKQPEAYLIRMMEEDTECSNGRNSTVTERLYVNHEEGLILEDVEQSRSKSRSKSFWSSLKDTLFSKRG